MTHHPHQHLRPDARPPRRHAREVTVGLLAVALLGIGAYLVLGGNLMSAAAGTPPAEPPLVSAEATVQPPVSAPSEPGTPEPDDVSDGAAAGVEGLDPELASRFLAAREAAAGDGVVIDITSGLRSEAEQRRLFDEAVEFHGTPEIAARYVLPPEESAHVQGTAIDVGPMGGQLWLAEHGAEFGLCRVYENEPWHFEPTVAPGAQCPATKADASSG